MVLTECFVRARHTNVTICQEFSGKEKLSEKDIREASCGHSKRFNLHRMLVSRVIFEDKSYESLHTIAA